MHPPRPNTYAASVVNDGLALLQSANRYQAAHFMHQHGIAFRVIVRVLAPGARVRLHVGAKSSGLNRSQSCKDITNPK